MEININLLIYIRTMASCGLVILLCFTQFYSYPKLHKLIKNNDYKNWHNNYLKKINYFTIPLMLTTSLSSSYLFFTTPTKHYIYLIALCLFILSTFTVFVPLHKQITLEIIPKQQSGKLLKYNWFRLLMTLILFLQDINNIL